jgi:flavodoxin
MKIVIIYSSRFGNGKKCVDVVDEQLRTKGHEVQVINAQKADSSQIPSADLYIFSGASEAFNIAKGIRKYLKKMPQMQGKKYALISTHAMKRAIALKKMEKLLSKKKKMQKVTTIDFKVNNKTAQQGNGLPEGYDDKLHDWVEGIAPLLT